MAEENPIERPIREERPKSVTCEFCECVLFASGEVKKKSDKAKAMEKAQDKLEAIEAESKTAREKAAQEEAERIARETNRHEPPPAAQRSSGFRVL